MTETGSRRGKRTHLSKSKRRDHVSAAVRVQPHRTVYRGFTPSRDTQIEPHPMRTGRTVLGSLRSSNPRIRASAKAAAVALGVLPKAVMVGSAEPFATGTRNNRDSLEG